MHRIHCPCPTTLHTVPKWDKREFANKVRLPYTNPPVLVGNWWDNVACDTKQPKYKINSTYRVFYTPQPISGRDTDAAWDTRLKSADSNFISQEGRGEATLNYFENFTTTYDLSFRHFPNCLKKKKPQCILRKKHPSGFIPAAEYLETYGNLTNWGLRKYYESVVGVEKEQYEQPYMTVTMRDYGVPPCPENYKFEKFIKKKMDPNYLPDKLVYEIRYNNGKPLDTNKYRDPGGRHPPVLYNFINRELIPPCITAKDLEN